jgi:Zn-dependent protease
MFNIPPAMLIANLCVLLVAFTGHEFAHAWTANFFGDDTPRLNGRLSLNPFVHLDVMGSLLLVIAGFGWAKPVPINPYVLQRHSRAAMMWVSFAGPLSNLLMAGLAAIPLRFGLVEPQPIFAGQLIPTLGQILSQFVVINVILAFFNLIPIPPLDGDQIAEFFFPPTWVQFLDRYIRPYGPVVLIMLVFVLPMLRLDILHWVIFMPAYRLAQWLIF